MSEFGLSTLPPVVAAEEMSEIDRYTISEIGIPGRVLMENAGRAATEIILQKWPELIGQRIAVVCGKGNNGGDGLVVARCLSEKGAACSVFLLGTKSEGRGDALANLQVAEKLGLSIFEVTDESQLPDFSTYFLLVDAILGTGSRGGLDGLLAQAVERMNASGSPIIALDLPTGVNTNTGEVNGPCIRASVCVTFGAAKRGLLFSPGREYAGELHVAEIGFPNRAIEAANIQTRRLDEATMRAWLPQRAPDAFKNRVGQILVIAGSQGFGGAARLASLAALRAGAGLVVLATPASLVPAVEGGAAEVIKLALPEEKGAVSLDAKFALAERLEWANVVAIGPGLGTEAGAQTLVKHVLSTFQKPIVLDADGLNVLVSHPERIREASGPVILTPHPGELARLIDVSREEIKKNPIEMARQVAAGLRQTLVLKGAPTVIASAGGEVLINSTGNAGMATAGSGDVLTGLIAGLLGQMPHDDPASLLRAAALGVYLHGLAGDCGRDTLGEWSMLAGDILNSIPNAFLHLSKTSYE
jgi:NAD(P)H-hydrate epimerase